MTTEMQEIAITEEKPLLTGQADTKVRPPHTHTHTHTHTNMQTGIDMTLMFPSTEKQT